MLIVTVACVLIALGTVVHSSAHHHVENTSRFDNYRLYYLYFETNEQVKVFQDLEANSDSCTFYGHAREPGQKLTIMVAAHKIGDITSLLHRYHMKHEILNYNFQETIDIQWSSVQPRNTLPTEFDWKHYFHLNTINDWMAYLAEKYPDIITLLELKSDNPEELPLKGLKLSKKQNNSAVFIEAGIHAREWISPATATFILNQLLTSTDAAVVDLSSNFDWIFFPVVNAMGYKFTFDNDRMWRKSRKSYGLCVGADLNRNFNAHWNETGSSPDSCRYDFSGSSAESEYEAKLIATFIRENKDSLRIKSYIALHSFSQLLMFPYGHSAEKAPNYNDLLSIGTKAITALAKRYGTVYKTGSVHDTIYPSSGASMDWAYSVADIKIAFTMELRGPTNSTDMFILPAEQIEPVGWETLDAFVALFQEARRLGYYN